MRKTLAELKPGDTVRTPNQGVFKIVKLIRVIDTKRGPVYNFLTDSPSGRLAGRGDITIEVIS